MKFYRGVAKLVGLTGGIASGKSTVSAMLRKKGIPVIDTDKITRDLSRKGQPIWREVKRVFGEEFFNQDGELDRKALGDIVFFDPDARNRLNEITHPLIAEEVQREINSILKTGYKGGIIIDAPVLIEGGWHEMVDEVWLVTASKETQIRRLKKRDGMSPVQAQMRIESQMTQEEKLKYAHKVIDNDNGYSFLEKQIDILVQDINGWRSRDGQA
jgi:dephospho-CoA kinase